MSRRRERTPERPIGGQYSQFKWGKFDRYRQDRNLMDPDNNELFELFQRTAFFPVAQERYPNLTTAYLEAVGVTQNTLDPMSDFDRRRAISDYDYFRNEFEQQQQALRENRERQLFDQQNADRRQHLRNMYGAGNSDIDEESSEHIERDAADDDRIAERNRERRWERQREAIERDNNSDYQEDLGADNEALADQIAARNAANAQNPVVARGPARRLFGDDDDAVDEIGDLDD